MSHPKHPTLPAEFFQPPELVMMSGRKQPSRIVEWLKEAKVTHITSVTGWPLVYRTALLPDEPKKAHDVGAVTFDFEAARVTRRKTA